LETFKAVVTAVLIAAFAALVAFLVNEAGVSQTTWQRYVYLLSGFEAIVFAAVGWMFGKEVHRGQAESAEKTAKEAQAGKDREAQKATEAAEQVSQEHERGRSLAQKVVAHAGDTAARVAAAGGAEADAHAGALQSLVKDAIAAYPDAAIHIPQ
jgi:hypothetical protein